MRIRRLISKLLPIGLTRPPLLHVNQTFYSKKTLNVIVLVLLGTVLVQPAHFQATENQLSKATMYLSRYGYLPPNLNEPSSAALIDKKIFSKALTDFQYFFGLNESGHLDTDTIRLMETPRCGVRDQIYGEKTRRQKRYTYMDPSIPKWTNKNLTYFMFNYSANININMSANEVDEELRKAFELWSEVTDLQFLKTNNPKADIIINWANYSHGDLYPFDGPGNTLAHAFSPGYGVGGDTHFDDMEPWGTGVKGGICLYQVAAHEFGHALGLGHSHYKGAVMAPYYRGYSSNFSLHEDDIEGIQSLYGTPPYRPTTPVTETTEEEKEPLPDNETTVHRIPLSSTSEDTTGINAVTQRIYTTKKPHSTAKVNKVNELCHLYTKIDTIFTDAHQRTFVFVGAKYWELITFGIAWGYPQAIASKWPGAPSHLDAALNYNSMTYFFKVDYHVWCYNGRELLQGFPKQIHDVFYGVPDYIDAAFNFRSNLYFFTGPYYVKYIPNLGKHETIVYRSIKKNWKGVPDKITAAFRDNFYNYIVLKKGYYYRLDYKTGSVVTNGSYPRNFKVWWLNCPSWPKRRYQYL
ncbi:hypothetical protein RUM44_003950 [Polyplax serrata]|uniref:Peptidase metallopeptidase domain-containing protein n=1 Tax=Polyplax serrata TaxID=468196 RepID=A0ABR1B312_POLSC